MKWKQRNFGTMVALGAMVLVAFQAMNSPALEPPPVHYLTIVKINNKWLVVQEGDTLSGPVTVRRGEKVVWNSDSSDVFFQFLDTRLFGGFTRKLKAGHKLTLVVGSAARLGVHYYAVFVLKDQVFAEGGSPPSVTVE